MKKYCLTLDCHGNQDQAAYYIILFFKSEFDFSRSLHKKQSLEKMYTKPFHPNKKKIKISDLFTRFLK